MGDHVTGHRRAKGNAATAPVVGETGDRVAQALDGFVDDSRRVTIDNNRDRRDATGAPNGGQFLPATGDIPLTFHRAQQVDIGTEPLGQFLGGHQRQSGKLGPIERNHECLDARAGVDPLVG